MKLNIATLLVAAVALVLLLPRLAPLSLTPMRMAGAAIAIPSFLLLCLARLQLGRAFSVRPKATTLVTTGLYARIRNPIYLFGALALAGLVLWFGRPTLLLFLVVLIPIQVIRSRKEARVLEEKFGHAYRDYRSKTWF